LAGNGGNVTKTYQYDAFGNEKNHDPQDLNPFRYCGEYFDKETGSIYLRARYYQPTTGRFLSKDTHWNVTNMIYGDNPQDPLGLNAYTYPNINAIQQSGNLYAYALNNPLLYKDPSGNIVLVDDAVILLVLGTGAVITVTAAWLSSPEGQKAINDGATAIYNGQKTAKGTCGILAETRQFAQLCADRVRGLYGSEDWRFTESYMGGHLRRESGGFSLPHYNYRRENRQMQGNRAE